jgi:hypothetical protein
MHWGGTLTGGIGSKAPAFDVFRTQLLALGNGGYPQNCRNIAIIHGSMNAGDRTIFDRYNYGEPNIAKLGSILDCRTQILTFIPTKSRIPMCCVLLVGGYFQKQSA